MLAFDAAVIAIGALAIGLSTLIDDAYYWPRLVIAAIGGGLIGSPFGRRIGEWLARRFA